MDRQIFRGAKGKVGRNSPSPDHEVTEGKRASRLGVGIGQINREKGGTKLNRYLIYISLAVVASPKKNLKCSKRDKKSSKKKDLSSSMAKDRAGKKETRKGSKQQHRQW